MSLASFGIKNRVFTLFSLVIITVLGLIALKNIPKLEDPALTSRVIVVTTTFPGMSVARMSTLVLKPVENTINSVPEVKYLFSTVSRGKVSSTIMIDDSITHIKPIVQDLRNKLSDIVLPPGCSKPSVNENDRDIAFVTLAVSYAGKSINQLDEVMEFLKRNFQSRFSSIRYAQVYGVPKKKFYIEADSHKLASYHLTVSQLQAILSDQHVLSSGGSIRTGVKNVIIVPDSEFRTLAHLQALRIPLPNSDKFVPLSDIASVSVKEVAPFTNKVYFNNKRVAILALVPVAKVNLVALGEHVKRAVTQLNDKLPKGFKIHYSTFRPSLISETVSEFAMNLYMAMFIVGVCVVVFLTWRAGILVGITVPLSMLLAITIMFYLNVPLERMTLAGLIISLGLLVDNGMVMVEDTRFAMDKGLDRVTAAKQVSKKLAAPLLVSQLTTILAFLPPLLAKNSASEYVGGLSLTLLIVLLCSWFLSQWAIPLLCSMFLKPTPKEKVQTQEQIFSKPTYQFYKKILTFSLNNRLFCVFLAAAAFYVSIWATQFVKVDFMPKFATTQVYMRVTLPNGTDTPQVMKKVKSLIPYLLNKSKNPEVKNVTLYAGANGPMLTAMNKASAGKNQAYFLIKIKKLSDQQISTLEDRFRQYVLGHYTDVKVKVGRLLGLSSEPGKVQVNIIGTDPQKLYGYGLQLENDLSKIPHTFAVSNSWGELTPALDLQLNRYALQQAGIPVKTVVDSVKNLINGAQVGQMDHGLNLIPVEFRLSKHERTDISAIEGISLYSSKLKRTIALRDVAKVKLNYTIPRVNTFQRDMTIRVIGFNVINGVRQTLKDLQPAIAKLNLPEGYRIKIRGESESQDEANSALFGSAAPCLFAILLILVYQFGSVRKMVIVFMIIPLAIIGVILGLVVTGVPFGFMPTFGVIALIGLVINDGVILLEAITEGREHGMGIRQSLLNAGQERLRPIILTTITTFLGMLPLIFFGGPLWEGLAICFVSGELVSTLLLLFMVPVLYSLFFRYWKQVQVTN